MAPDLEDTYNRAVDMLRGNITPRGLMAVASDERAMYEAAIFARDCIIGSLGASLGLGREYKTTFQATLETLGAYQNELGQIPHAVTPRKEGDLAGYESQDSNLWYVLGHCYLFRT